MKCMKDIDRMWEVEERYRLRKVARMFAAPHQIGPRLRSKQNNRKSALTQTWICYVFLYLSSVFRFTARKVKLQSCLTSLSVPAPTPGGGGNAPLYAGISKHQQKQTAVKKSRECTHRGVVTNSPPLYTQLHTSLLN